MRQGGSVIAAGLKGAWGGRHRAEEVWEGHGEDEKRVGILASLAW